jgi:protoporphyrinogen oxidase
MNVTIIGAGPTGLGAANRLEELGHNWVLFEGTDNPGGLAGSVINNDFIWDFGGHVQFSHYNYFDKLMDDLLGIDGWLYHERESWIWMRNRFIPYPLQFNIRYLPIEERDACIRGFEKANLSLPDNFGTWINATFGKDLADIFMRPYNFKVWACYPEDMDWRWIGERVAVVDINRIKHNIYKEIDDKSWGPNNTFRFPKFGGTGSIWNALSKRLPSEKQHFNKRLVRINTQNRNLFFEDGTSKKYEILISTIPLNELIYMSDLSDNIKKHAKKLMFSSTHVVGVGLKGIPGKHIAKKCWIYFPESNCPFYRVTIFSNYSPNNVPDINKYWSLLAEVSESPRKPVSGDVVSDVCRGLNVTNLISSQEDIVSIWHCKLDYGYPTPFLGRDEVLMELHNVLEPLNIFSRGRFGAWKYEVSNQDHSMAQGVECVERIFQSGKELTLNHPEIVNNLAKIK